MKLQGKEHLDYVKNHLRKDSSTAAHKIIQKITAGVDSVEKKIMSGSGLRKKYYERTGGFFLFL